MDPNAFLMGAAVPSMRWDHPGATCSGRVVHRETRLQTVFGTGEVKKWPSGDPMYQLVVHIQTSLRDPSIENDNGTRAIYIKGKNFTDAARDAVREAGALGIEVGGMISVVYTGDDMTSKAPIKPKMFQVRYQAAPQMQQQPMQPQGFPSQYNQAPQPQHTQSGQWTAFQQSAYTGAGFPAAPAQHQQAGPPVYLQHDPHVPAHHEQGPPPDWAFTGAPPPVAPSEPPPPSMSTLAHIRANRDAPTSGQPFGEPEPAF